MNELLQKHGCSNVFTVPEGLKELMADITREVLRDQPVNMFDYIANYLSVLLITREHGVLAEKILDDLCDCKPTVADHLVQLGFEQSEADMIADIIKYEVEATEPIEGKEKVKETLILKKILARSVLDEDSSAKVCQVARNAYRDYWYRKKLFSKHFKFDQDEPWEIAARRTLELYKRTKPSFTELTRATQKIQAAYRGYYVRRNILRHLVPKEPPGKKGRRKKKESPKVDLPGPPLDVALEREIDLGPVIDINVKEDNVKTMFEEHVGETLGLKYDPTKTLTHVEEEYLKVKPKTSKARTVTVEAMFRTYSNREMRSKPEAKIHSSQFEHSRRSRYSSEGPLLPATKGQRRSIIDSNKQKTAAHFYHRISFAQYPAEIIIDDFPDDDEVPEELGNDKSKTLRLPEVRIKDSRNTSFRVENVQVPEFTVQAAKSQEQDKIEIQDSKVAAEIMADEVVEDISENIQDDQSGGDQTIESGLTATVETGNATDPEDTGDELPEDQE